MLSPGQTFYRPTDHKVMDKNDEHNKSGQIYRKRTRATRCIMPVVLYMKVDAHFDELATVVGRTKLTSLATVDVL